jgi:hypothetical protein
MARKSPSSSTSSPNSPVEFLGDREIGNSEMKPVDGMNAELAGTA